MTSNTSAKQISFVSAADPYKSFILMQAHVVEKFSVCFAARFSEPVLVSPTLRVAKNFTWNLPQFVFVGDSFSISPAALGVDPLQDNIYFVPENAICSESNAVNSTVLSCNSSSLVKLPSLREDTSCCVGKCKPVPLCVPQVSLAQDPEFLLEFHRISSVCGTKRPLPLLEQLLVWVSTQPSILTWSYHVAATDPMWCPSSLLVSPHSQSNSKRSQMFLCAFCPEFHVVPTKHSLATLQLSAVFIRLSFLEEILQSAAPLLFYLLAQVSTSQLLCRLV